jgi:acyl dehydratase
MAYTIVKSDGTVLTTIADGTINTTSTSLGLPGRNFAGYGQTVDTNFVHQLENYAANTPPANPLRGQLWYDLNNSLLKVCPTDGLSNANAWVTLATSSGTSVTTFGTVSVTGNLQANNITAVNALVGDTITVRLATVTANATIANAAITTGNIGTLNTQVITTGANTSAGTITGTWTANGGSAGNTLIVTNGNLVAVTGIKTNNYYYANGDPFNPTGTYNNGNVFDYLVGANSVVQFTGNIAPGQVTTGNITAGANTTAGLITGNWTLTAGSRFNATYADLAERFEADAYYDAGTVVEMGGEKEITAVQYELSDDVFGVVSDTAAYLMNSGAGDDTTHPPIAVGGRVKVKVNGIVKKGQRLVSAGNGIARAAKPGEATAFNIIGRALENKTTTDTGVVEAFVKIN